MNSYEIAKLSGVSVMTVSRVINGSPNVAENTKKKVQEIIDKYGYTPNPMARNLAGKNSNVIGLYLADINSDEKNNIPSYEAPYFLSFISSIIGYANKYNHKILVNIINDESQFQEMRQDFKNRAISGGIFLGFENATPLIIKLAEENFKMVLLDQDPNLFKNNNNLIFADIDDEEAAFNIVKYMVENGDKIKCTPDHELALNAGGYVEAKDSIGKELKGFYTYTNQGPGSKYRHINSISNARKKQSVMMYEALKGPVIKWYHIYHWLLF